MSYHFRGTGLTNASLGRLPGSSLIHSASPGFPRPVPALQAVPPTWSSGLAVAVETASYRGIVPCGLALSSSLRLRTAHGTPMCRNIQTAQRHSRFVNSFLVRPTLLPAGGLMTGQRNPSSAFTRLRLVDCQAFVGTKKHRLDDRLASKRVTGCSASAVLASSSLPRLPGR